MKGRDLRPCKTGPSTSSGQVCATPPRQRRTGTKHRTANLKPNLIVSRGANGFFTCPEAKHQFCRQSRNNPTAFPRISLTTPFSRPRGRSRKDEPNVGAGRLERRVRLAGRETMPGIHGFCSIFPFGAIREVPLLRRVNVGFGRWQTPS